MDWMSEDPDSVLDSSQNKLHGIASGTVRHEGMWGSARGFDGIDDFIEVPDDDLLDIDEGITFSFWINIRENMSLNTAAIFSKMSRGGPINYQFFVSLTDEANCSFLFSYGESSNLVNCQVYSTTVPNIVGTGWRNVIFSYQFGDPSSAIFVFDLERIEGKWLVGTGRISPPLSDGPLTFGKQLDPEYPLYFKGDLDEVQLYDISLGWEAIRYAFFPR